MGFGHIFYFVASQCTTFRVSCLAFLCPLRCCRAGATTEYSTGPRGSLYLAYIVLCCFILPFHVFALLCPAPSTVVNQILGHIAGSPRQVRYQAHVIARRVQQFLPSLTSVDMYVFAHAKHSSLLVIRVDKASIYTDNRTRNINASSIRGVDHYRPPGRPGIKRGSVGYMQRWYGGAAQRACNYVSGLAEGTNSYVVMERAAEIVHVAIKTTSPLKQGRQKNVAANVSPQDGCATTPSTLKSGGESVAKGLLCQDPSPAAPAMTDESLGDR